MAAVREYDCLPMRKRTQWMRALAKQGVKAVQKEVQEPKPMSEQNKHGQQLVLSLTY